MAERSERAAPSIKQRPPIPPILLPLESDTPLHTPFSSAGRVQPSTYFPSSPPEKAFSATVLSPASDYADEASDGFVAQPCDSARNWPLDDPRLGLHNYPDDLPLTLAGHKLGSPDDAYLLQSRPSNLNTTLSDTATAQQQRQQQQQLRPKNREKSVSFFLNSGTFPQAPDEMEMCAMSWSNNDDDMRTFLQAGDWGTMPDKQGSPYLSSSFGSSPLKKPQIPSARGTEPGVSKRPRNVSVASNNSETMRRSSMCSVGSLDTSRRLRSVSVASNASDLASPRKLRAASVVSNMSTAPKTPKDRMLQAAEQAAAAKRSAAEEQREHAAHRTEENPLVPWRQRLRELLIDTSILDRIVIVVIIANSLCLAYEDPSPGANNPVVLEVFDIIFFVFYLIEFVLKIAALGVWGRPNAYFGSIRKVTRRGKVIATIRISWWGVLDFIVVVSGFLTVLVPLLFGSGTSKGPLAALRSFRLLRPLKAVSVLREMRVLLKSILQALPRLLNMLLLFVLFLLAFGIVAVQLWQGKMRNQCFSNESLFGPDSQLTRSKTNIPSTEIGRVCSNTTDTIRGYHCSWGATCVDGCSNPRYYGKESFDNIGAALLTLNVAVTKEGWALTMYSVMDATNQFSSIFFVLLTFFGAFCIINLTVVIVNNVFDYNVAYEEAKLKLQLLPTLAQTQEEALSVRSVQPRAFGNPLEPLLPKSSNASRTSGSSESEEYKPGFVSPLAIPYASPSLLSPESMYTLPEGATSFSFSEGRAADSGAGSPLPDRSDGFVALEWPKHLDVTSLRDYQRVVINVVTSRIYEYIVFVVIIANVVVLSMWYHGMSDSLFNLMLVLYLFFALFFMLDAMLKILVLGFRNYFQNRWNLFDFVIALVGVVHICFENPFYQTSQDSVKYLKVIRSLQVMRVLKVVEQFPRLKRWARVFLQSLKSAMTLTALLALIIFIYSLLGMQLFAGRFCHLAEDDSMLDVMPDWAYSVKMSQLTPEPKTSGCHNSPRANFDTIFLASLSLFQILSGEDWQVIMYNGMASRGDYVAPYFLSWYFIGNCLLLNLFVSILISRVTSVKEEDLELERQAVEWKSQRSETRKEEKRKAHKLTFRDKTALRFQGCWHTAAVKSTDLLDYALLNTVRSRLGNILESWPFEVLIVLFIALSCIVLAMYTPILPPDATFARTLETIDLVSTAVFTAECGLKIFAWGFITDENTYLQRDPWNRLDLFIVITSLISMATEGSSTMRNLKILRSVRVLRPLRFINKFKGLKVVLASLWLAIPSLGMVAVLGFLGWLVFAILGVQLFAGTFHACTLSVWGDMTSLYPNKTSCLAAQDPATKLPLWQTHAPNFDHIFSSFLSLFEMASTEGWVDIMYLGMDSVSPEIAPQKDSRPYLAIYFVGFVLLGAYFVVNLFVSALVDAFQEQRLQEKGSTLLSEEQQQWVAVQKVLLRHVRQPVTVAEEQLQGARLWTTKLVTHKYFDTAINVAIVLNVLILSTEHWNEPDYWDTAAEAINIVFVVFFAFEAACKITAYTAKGYFASTQNKFDFFLVVVSLIGIIFNLFFAGGIGGILSVFRASRLLRIARLVHAAKGVRSLVRTLFLTFPTMVNVAGIMMLIFFCYAVLGMFLFGKVKEGEYLAGHATFHDFVSALLLLLRTSTGEAWPGLMHDCAVESPFCSNIIDDCGDPVAAYAYFVTFVVIETYVILNLFIAILLDSFNDEVADEVMEQTLSDEEMDNFFTVWRKHDPLQTCTIEVSKLPSFLRTIGPPLGPDVLTNGQPMSDRMVIRKYIAPMHDCKVTRDGKLDQQSLLTHLCMRTFQEVTGAPVSTEMKADFERRLAEVFSMRAPKREQPAERNKLADNPLLVHHTAVLVQSMWRGRLARARLHLQLKRQEEEEEEEEDDAERASQSPRSVLQRQTIEKQSKTGQSIITEFASREATETLDYLAYKFPENTEGAGGPGGGPKETDELLRNTVSGSCTASSTTAETSALEKNRLGSVSSTAISPQESFTPFPHELTSPSTMYFGAFDHSLAQRGHAHGHTNDPASARNRRPRRARLGRHQSRSAWTTGGGVVRGSETVSPVSVSLSREHEDEDTWLNSLPLSQEEIALFSPTEQQTPVGSYFPSSIIDTSSLPTSLRRAVPPHHKDTFDPFAEDSTPPQPVAQRGTTTRQILSDEALRAIL